MAKKRNFAIFDEKIAIDKALDFEFSKNVFVTPELKKFMELKGIQHAVTPSIFLPGFIVSTSNVMGMAKLQFTEDWFVKQNLFVLLIANKGTGKTPASKTWMGPLIGLERAEKKSFDGKKKQKKGKGKGKNKKRRQDDEQNDEMDEDDDTSTEETPTAQGDSEQFMFHKKTRLCDQITPEALILSLAYGSGNLVIKADEFKGFHDKCIEKADNISAICTAFSGEDIKYTTIKRGEISIYDSRLNIFGGIQPGPLGELLNNKEDHQGLWDRFIMIPAAADPTVKFADKLKPIPDEDKIDVTAYLSRIRDIHKEPRVYHVDKEAMSVFEAIDAELTEIDEKSNHGNEVSGMTKKAYPNVQKLATVLCCARETLELLSSDEAFDEKNPGVAFTVKIVDVEAAYDVIKQSMQTFKSFKISLGIELGEVKDIETELNQEISEDMILGAAHKIRKMYGKADENKKILISQVKRSKLYPPKVNVDVFIEALVKFKIVQVEKTIGANHKNADMLVLTTQTCEPDTVRVFRLLYDLNVAANEVFDPLGMFHDAEEMD